MTDVKIEIVIAQQDLRGLLRLLDSAGAEGFTALDVAAGKGPEQGEVQREGVIPATHHTLVFSIVHESEAPRVVETVRAYVQERRGMLLWYPVSVAQRGPEPPTHPG